MVDYSLPTARSLKSLAHSSHSNPRNLEDLWCFVYTESIRTGLPNPPPVNNHQHSFVVDCHHTLYIPEPTDDPSDEDISLEEDVDKSDSYAPETDAEDESFAHDGPMSGAYPLKWKADDDEDMVVDSILIPEELGETSEVGEVDVSFTSVSSNNTTARSDHGSDRGGIPDITLRHIISHPIPSHPQNLKDENHRRRRGGVNCSPVLPPAR